MLTYKLKPLSPPRLAYLVAFIYSYGRFTVPRSINYHEPDAIDCNTMVSAIGSDFSCKCDITTAYERDQVVVLVRCYTLVQEAANVVQVQAIVRTPLRTARSLYAMQYSALLDCWHQMDRGVLAAATRPIEHSWNGRPKVPERRNAQ